MIYHLPNKKTFQTLTLDEYLQQRREDSDFNPQFSFEGECVEIEAARNRLININQGEQKYNSVLNNCEDFAHFEFSRL